MSYPTVQRYYELTRIEKVLQIKFIALIVNYFVVCYFFRQLLGISRLNLLKG